MSSNDSKAKKIGGEYGEIRANIDVDKLNTYLSRHVKVVRTPVEVKQFKVCSVLFCVVAISLNVPLKFGQVNGFPPVGELAMT